MATDTTRKPILICGGGPSALLLARSLLRSKIPFVVFEREATPTFRAQGYRLRLSSEGLDAIEDVLGPEGFQKFWDVCGKTGGNSKGGGLSVLDAVSGEEIPQGGPPPQAKKDDDKSAPAAEENKPPPTKLVTREPLTSRNNQTVGISRGDMRAVFREGCEPYIRWDHHVAGYEVTENGVRAVFADGSKSEEGELLIGAEGIHSKVAKQVSNGKIKTYDTKARGIHGQAPASAFEGLGEGVWRLVDESKDGSKAFIITNVRPNADPKEMLGWTMGASPGVISPPGDDFSIIGKQAAEIAKSLSANWNKRFKPLFDEMSVDEAAFWKITCSSPSGVPDWPNEPRVTVIGDAVHSMTPAGGIGWNTASRDCANLGGLLRHAEPPYEGITRKYEERMRVYASEAVATSYKFALEGFGIDPIDPKTSTVVKV